MRGDLPGPQETKTGGILLPPANPVLTAYSRQKMAQHTTREISSEFFFAALIVPCFEELLDGPRVTGQRQSDFRFVPDRSKNALVRFVCGCDGGKAAADGSLNGCYGGGARLLVHLVVHLLVVVPLLVLPAAGAVARGGEKPIVYHLYDGLEPIVGHHLTVDGLHIAAAWCVPHQGRDGDGGRSSFWSDHPSGQDYIVAFVIEFDEFGACGELKQSDDQRWEHLVLTQRSMSHLNSELKEAERQGWELVSVILMPAPWGGPGYTAFVKRPTRRPEDRSNPSSKERGSR